MVFGGRLRLLSRPGFSNIFKSLLLAALLVGVYFLGAGIITYLALRRPPVEVPKEAGKSKEARREELTDAGPRRDVKREAQNDRGPAGAVSDQSPSAGTIVKTGQIVRVSVSLGAAPVGQNPQK